MMVEGRKLNLTVGLLIVGIVVTLSSPGFSYAATFELHPIGPGRFDSWVLGGSDSPGLADSKIGAVSTSDGNGSYLYRQADSKRQTFEFPPVPVPDNALVESVIIHANATRVDDLDSTLELSVEIGTSGQKYSDAAEGIVPTSIWTDMARNMTINPFTGNNWTGSEINSWTLNGDDIYFGVNNQKRQGSEIRVTEIWLEVNVKDNPPEIFVPDNWPDVEATNRTDTRVDFSANITATDDYTPVNEILIECTPESGSGFSIENSTDLGHLKEITHTVTCTATDNSGQTDTDSFEIKIVDTTAPIFTVLPTDPDAVDAIGINTPVDIETIPELEVFDLVSLPSEITISNNTDSVSSALANSPECNSPLTCFYAGNTTVTYTATDFANNSNSSATQNVTVNPLPLVMEWDEEDGFYSIGDQVYFTIDDYRGNLNNSKSDIINVNFKTSSDQAGLLLQLEETGNTTHIFDSGGKVLFELNELSTSYSGEYPTLLATPTDQLNATYSTSPAPPVEPIIPDQQTVTAEVVDINSLVGASGAIPTADQRITFTVIGEDVLTEEQATEIRILTGEQFNDKKNLLTDTKEKYQSRLRISAVDSAGDVISQDSSGNPIASQSTTMKMIELDSNNDIFRQLTSVVRATSDASAANPSSGIFYAPAGSKIIAEYAPNTFSDPEVYTTGITVIPIDPGQALDTFDLNFDYVQPCENDNDADGICDEFEKSNGLTILLEDDNIGLLTQYYLPCVTTTYCADGTLVPQGNACSDGSAGIELPPQDTMCPSPDRKDVYFEIDYMSGHHPDEDAIGMVVDMFDKAPVINVPSNPDPSKYGIRLHALVGDDIQTHKNVIPFVGTPDNPGFQEFKKNWFGTPLERGCEIQTAPDGENVVVCPALTAAEKQEVEDKLTAKRQVFHYVLFAHSLLGQETSTGYAEKPGNDIMITLGSYAGVDTGQNSGVGSTMQQAATLAHEGGHNLGLSHDGKVTRPESRNCSPNYLSVMSYSFQLATLVPDRPLDYSRVKLPNLDRTALSESLPIPEYLWPDSSGTALKTVFGSAGVPVVVPTGGEDYPDLDGDGSPDFAGKYVDWNNDGSYDTDGTTYNNLQLSNLGIPGCDQDISFDKYQGWNDWDNLIYNFRLTSSTFASGAYTSVEALDEPDLDTFEALQAGLLEVLVAAVIDSTLDQGTIDSVIPQIAAIDPLVTSDPPDYQGAITQLDTICPLLDQDVEAFTLCNQIITSYTASITPSEFSDHSEAENPIADAGGEGGGDVFTSFYEAFEGDDITFDGSQSTDPDTCIPDQICDSITIFNWTIPTQFTRPFNQPLDDTPTLTTNWGQWNNHTGENSTTYLISLQVTDNGLDENGSPYTEGGPRVSLPDTVVVAIHNVAPTIDDVVNATINEGTSFDIDVGFTDPGFLDHHTATIDWGDGIVEPGTVDETDGNGNVTASHQYGVGNWTGTITVDDGDEGTASDSFTVTVLNIPPTVTFTSEPPSEIIYGQTVTIAGTIEDSSTEFEVTVFWEEGTVEVVPTGEDFSVSYEYLQVTDDTFTLTIIVCDDTGTLEGCVPFEYTVNVNYNIPEEPFSSPVPGAQYEQGRTIPVKYSVLDFNDNPVEGATVLLYWESVADGIEHEAVDKKGSNQATLKQDVYQLNIETAEMPLGDVIIRVTTDDGQVREQTVEIK